MGIKEHFVITEALDINDGFVLRFSNLRAIACKCSPAFDGQSKTTDFEVVLLFNQCVGVV